MSHQQYAINHQSNIMLQMYGYQARQDKRKQKRHALKKRATMLCNAYWQAFLSKHQNSAITDEQIIALYDEILHIFNKEFMASDMADALSARYAYLARLTKSVRILGMKLW